MAGIRVRKPIGEGWEYSLDNTSWQTSPLFTTLKGLPFQPGRVYPVFARNTALGASVQGSIVHGATSNLSTGATLTNAQRFSRGSVVDPDLNSFSEDFPDFA